MPNRDYKIDFMRMLGTLLVMLSHVLPPNFIQNIRTFDVVMLIYISALSFNITYKTDVSLKQYLKKRFKKLIIPTYILLAIIFGLSVLLCLITNRQNPFDTGTIIHSFLFLNNGIGYIWISRVYFEIAIFSYFVKKLLLLRKTVRNIFLLFIGLVITTITLMGPQIYGNNVIIDSYFLEVIPYFIVVLLGLLVANNQIKSGIIVFVSFILITGHAVYNNAFDPNMYKYPPNLYYLSYGLLVSIILYNISWGYNSYIEWFSKNSFSIYLAHIPILLGLNLLSEKITVIDKWYIKYVFIATITTIIIKFYQIIKEKTYGNF